MPGGAKEVSVRTSRLKAAANANLRKNVAVNGISASAARRRRRGTEPAPCSGMRSIRRLSQVILTFLGGSTVVYAVYRIPGMRERVLLVILGLLIMELGIWQVTAFMFPNQREFKPLRKETEYFLKLVRRLNRASVAAERGSPNALLEIDRVHEEMHHSVDRMRRLAGESEEPASAPVPTAVATPR